VVAKLTEVVCVCMCVSVWVGWVCVGVCVCVRGWVGCVCVSGLGVCV